MFAVTQLIQVGFLFAALALHAEVYLLACEKISTTLLYILFAETVKH